MKKAVQLYAIRVLAAQDLKLAIKTIAEIGYEGVELACINIHEQDPIELKSWLDEYKLEAMSDHINVDDLFNHTDELLDWLEKIGCKRVAIPGIWTLKTRNDVLEAVEKIKAVLPKIKAKGMRLYYHNHAYEFEKDGDDYLIDILASELTKDELFLEFDMFWVYNGGECPVKYFNKYKDRMDIFHAKDGIERVGTALGEGKVDTVGAFKAAKANGYEWAIVESEASDQLEAQVEAIKKDYDALLRLLEV